MEERIRPELAGIQHSLLFPVYGRARETLRRNPIIRDEPAVRTVARLDYDFSRFDRSWQTLLGCAIRTELIDRQVGLFLSHHPDGVIVQLGVGLDARAERLDTGAATWYGLDLPEVIALRRRVLPPLPHERLIVMPVTGDWEAQVDTGGREVCLIAEGLLMYLPEREVRRLFTRLAERFPGAEMVFDVASPEVARRMHRHPALRAADPGAVGSLEGTWGLGRTRSLERWDRRIQVTGEWRYFDYHRGRWGWLWWLTRIMPWLGNGFRLVAVRFDPVGG